MVLQSMAAGEGGGLEHELWFNVVAATISFDTLDDNGTGSGLGHVWNAVVHRIDFPANTAIREALASWLENEVASAFEMSLERHR